MIDVTVHWCFGHRFCKQTSNAVPHWMATFSGIMYVHIFELSKLSEEDSEESSRVLDWLKFLNCDEVDEMEPIAEKNSNVKQAVELYSENCEKAIIAKYQTGVILWTQKINTFHGWVMLRK